MRKLTALKKSLFIIFLTLSFVPAFSQTNTNTGDQLVAEGSAKKKIKPDIAQLSFTVEKMDTIEHIATQKLNLEVQKLVNSLYQIGFTTKSFRISEYNLSSTEEDKKKWYIATNSLKLEFSLDTKLIDAIYQMIQDSALSDLEIDFDTKISESLEKETKHILVQEAIKDAKANADNIAKSLGVKLGNVKQVSKYVLESYDIAPKVNQIKYTPPKVLSDNAFQYNTAFDKIEVEEIELEEKITIVYQISKS